MVKKRRRVFLGHIITSLCRFGGVLYVRNSFAAYRRIVLSQTIFRLAEKKLSGFYKYRIKIQKHSGFSSRLAVKGNENYVVQVTNVSTERKPT